MPDSMPVLMPSSMLARCWLDAWLDAGSMQARCLDASKLDASMPRSGSRDAAGAQWDSALGIRHSRSRLSAKSIITLLIAKRHKPSLSSFLPTPLSRWHVGIRWPCGAWRFLLISRCTSYNCLLPTALTHDSYKKYGLRPASAHGHIYSTVSAQF